MQSVSGVRSADRALMMDLQSFVHSSAGGFGLSDLFTSFRTVNRGRLIDILLKLHEDGILHIRISHAAHDRDLWIKPEAVIGDVA
ncbi:MAG: hypothetical protein ABIR33_13410 [Pyrinomonadaceae bacterium]